MKLFTGVRIIFSSLIFVGLVIGMQACGGGGGSTPVTPSNADPIGYYAGTFNYSSPVGQTENNVRAIVDSDKFMMVHINTDPTKNILYVGTFTDITETTFTADVKIYFNGGVLGSIATITNGAITEKTSMSGTLSGTGSYSATSFSLSYDQTVNARVTTNIDRTSTATWLVPTVTSSGVVFDSPSVGTFVIQPGLTIAHSLLQGCQTNNEVLTNVPGEQTDRIQKYTANYDNASNCDNFSANFSLEHYITPYDNGGADNRYLWIAYNDANFFASDELTLKIK